MDSTILQWVIGVLKTDSTSFERPFNGEELEIVKTAGKFAIFSSIWFAIRNFRSTQAVYGLINGAKTRVLRMDCELDCHKFWTKQIQTKWNRHLRFEKL